MLFTCRSTAAPNTHSHEWRSRDHEAVDEAETDAVGGGEDHGALSGRGDS